MTRKPTFDRTAAFKSIVGAETQQAAETEAAEAPPVRAVVEAPQQAAAAHLVTVPEKVEKRSLRKHVLLTPSLGRAAERKARSMGLSLNEAINQLLARWVESE